MNTRHTMDARELLHEGRLDEAIETESAEVRAHPGDPDRRALLADLLCIVGNFERADAQLDAIAKLLPGAAVAVALVRQLIRAETWRQQCFTEGRVPEFLERPDPRMQLHLSALLALREVDRESAATLLGQAEELRPVCPGVADGKAFDDFRDCDDLSAGLLEVLTSTGKYYWIPTERIRRLTLRPVEHARDLIWRRAGMEVTNGPEGEVFLPTIYAPAQEDRAARLGRLTTWTEAEPVLGTGLRTFLVGEDVATLMELNDVVFNAV